MATTKTKAPNKLTSKRAAKRKAPSNAKAPKAKPTGFDNATFDARPDRLDFRDLTYLPPLRSLAPRWPLVADIGRFLPSYIGENLVLDQGQEGACTGFGLACVINYLLWVRHVEAGAKPPFETVSPRMLYELARRYDEWQGESYDGSSCRGALKGWHKHGVCTEVLWPYRTPRGAVKLVTPQEHWALDAVSRPLGVYYRVDRKSVVDIQAAIQQIGAVYVSANVHDGWGRVPATQRPPQAHADLPLIPPKQGGRTGGHAFALVGFNEHGFIVQNSWGKGWGACGFAVMSYADWVSFGTDAWACALGVPQDQARQPNRIEALRWPSRSGRSLGFFDTGTRNPHNPPDDPWPIDREFAHQPYEPWTTAQAYAHTLVTGNDGKVCLTDLTRGVDGDAARLVDDIVAVRPKAWLDQQQPPAAKLMLYAHGGLNSEEASIDRIRVMAPYFEANGIYPLFLTWRTGPLETLMSMLEDKFSSFFGVSTPDEMRAAGFFDDLADARDRRVEELAHKVLKGVWSEMRENAQRGTRAGHGLALLAKSLAALRDALAPKPLEVHLVGHSAGSILLGHLLGLLAGAAKPVAVRTCSLYAAACSVRFAVDHYLVAAKAILASNDIHLHYLRDREEKDDFLAGTKGLHLYGKSLLYLVSRALDDQRKMPLLGMERAVIKDFQNDSDQWAPGELPAIQAWLAGFAGQRHDVKTPSVTVNKKGKTEQAKHGSFDNSIEAIGDTIARIRGAKLVQPIEWLDY